MSPWLNYTLDYDVLPAKAYDCIVSPMNPTDPFDILIHVQPWQGLLFDAEQILDLVAGQLGASGLTLSIKAPDAQDAIALSPDENLLAVRVAPGALFQPNGDRYASTRLRPVLSPTLKSRQPAARLAGSCRDRSQRFRLRVSALRDAALAARYPEIVSCNALSLASPGHLCPSNPDVVELVRCQILDLSQQFEPDVIELENITLPDRFQPASATGTWPTQPGPVESALLAICFCPSCRQQAIHAGVDAASALRSVHVHLMRWLRNEKPRAGTIDDLLAEDDILAAYAARQRKALLAAIQLWTRAAPDLSLLIAKDRISTHQPTSHEDVPAAQPQVLAVDNQPHRTGAPWNPSFGELAAIAPRLTFLAAPETSLEQYPHPTVASGRALRLEAAIDAAAPSFAGGPDIVRCLGDLARAGLDAVQLENGLSVSPTRRPFIRQAIRTARRERNL